MFVITKLHLEEGRPILGEATTCENWEEAIEIGIRFAKENGASSGDELIRKELEHCEYLENDWSVCIVSTTKRIEIDVKTSIN